MRIIVIALLAVSMTGCGTYGEPLWLARIADANDPCQTQNRSAAYQRPSFCGASAGPRYYTRDYRTGRIIYVTR